MEKNSNIVKSNIYLFIFLFIYSYINTVESSQGLALSAGSQIKLDSK
jgi:hypothetical protein